MTPYLRAHAAYHRHGPPGIPWLDAIDFHLITGALMVNDDRLFLLARQVTGLTDDEQLTLTEGSVQVAFPADWHVWTAAGDMRHLLHILEERTPLTVSFQRRGGRLKTYHAAKLARYLDRELRAVPF